MNFINIKSYAKINIGLKVLRKRSDGYHDIDTIFQLIDIHDQIKLTDTGKRKKINIAVNSTEVPADESNLAYRAADLFMKRYDIQNGVDISIKKKIPISAGLGGGSSNAAYTLAGLDKLWGVGCKLNDLYSMSVELGSDVPFFLYGGTAIGRGKGELLEKVESDNNYYVVIINPGLKISTAWVFQNVKIDLTKTRNSTKMSDFDFGIRAEEYRQDLVNDLESVVIPCYPVIAYIKKLLIESGAVFASMSGSGSTVFGIYKDLQLAKQAVKSCVRPEWKSLLTAPIKQCDDWGVVKR